MSLLSYIQDALSNAGTRGFNTLSQGGSLGSAVMNALTRQSTMPAGDARNALNAPIAHPIIANYRTDQYRPPAQTTVSSSSNPYTQTGLVSYGSSSSRATALPQFTPTYFNGQLYTDPQSLANAQIAAAQTAAKAAQPQFDVTYNGTEFTDPAQYYSALIKSALDTHNQNVQAINKAYNQGLITYQQQQDALNQSRQSVSDQHTKNLNQLAGYFSTISPYAYQSSQDTQTGQENTAFANQNKALDTQGQNLDTSKQNFTDQYNQSLSNENQQFQGQNDALANAQRSNQQQTTQAGQQAAQNLQNYIDSVKNNLQNYNSQVSAAQAANAAGTQSATKQATPLDIAYSLYPTYSRDLAAGGQSTAQQNLFSHLQQNGLPTNPDFLNYLYGQFGNPSFQNAYNGYSATSLPAAAQSAAGY